MYSESVLREFIGVAGLVRSEQFMRRVLCFARIQMKFKKHVSLTRNIKKRRKGERNYG